MSHAPTVAVFEIAFGLLLALHCPRAALNEYRTGVAVGRHGRYRRPTEPIRFWTVVGLPLAAGLMGAGFVIVGAATLVRG